jgi:rhamnosyltransferase
MKLGYRRVAVCLAAYNGIDYLDEQINSILLQRNVDVQIFVSVDLSSDGTETFLTGRALSEPRLTLLPFGCHFGAAAPNFYRLLREVDLSSFDYLSFADQDDIWHPEKLFNAYLLLNKHNAHGYSSGFTAFWPTGGTRVVNKASQQKSWDYLFEGPGPGCTFVLCKSMALKLQELVLNAGINLLRIEHHDWMIYAYARAHGFVWVIDPWPSMWYRQHSKNQVGVNIGCRAFLFRTLVVLKGGGFQQSLLIANLIQMAESPMIRCGLSNGRLGYFWLAFRANQCRRKRTHQLLFFIACLLLSIINPKLDKPN